MSDAYAARVGDNHVCDAHAGGPILPVGAANVEINGLPAARQLDLARCDAPPNMIALGEPTVLIEGMPAAREGDLVIHGGQIEGHSADVTIGAPLTGKAKRLAFRRALIAYAQKTSGDPAVLKAASDLAFYNVAIEHARLAMATYAFGNIPEGWSREGTWNHANGFFAQLFRSDIDGSYVLAFRGTDTLEELMNPESPDDKHGNLPQAFGLPAEQYEDARELALAIGQQHAGNLSITGHSLGGGLASLASLVAAAPGFSFDAAGLHANTATGTDIHGAPLDLANANALIQAVYLSGEALTRLQGEGAHAYGDPHGVRFGFGPPLPVPTTDPSSQSIAYFAPGLFPTAAGTPHEVPLTPTQLTNPSLAGPTNQFYVNPALPPGHPDPFLGFKQAGERHGIWHLVDAIEHQKDLLIAQLCTALGVPPLVP